MSGNKKRVLALGPAEGSGHKRRIRSKLAGNPSHKEYNRLVPLYTKPSSRELQAFNAEKRRGIRRHPSNFGLSLGKEYKKKKNIKRFLQYLGSAPESKKPEKYLQKDFSRDRLLDYKVFRSNVKHYRDVNDSKFKLSPRRSSLPRGSPQFQRMRNQELRGLRKLQSDVGPEFANIMAYGRRQAKLPLSKRGTALSKRVRAFEKVYRKPVKSIHRRLGHLKHFNREKEQQKRLLDNAGRLTGSSELAMRKKLRSLFIPIQVRAMEFMDHANANKRKRKNRESPRVIRKKGKAIQREIDAFIAKIPNIDHPGMGNMGIVFAALHEKVGRVIELKENRLVDEGAGEERAAIDYGGLSPAAKKQLQKENREDKKAQLEADEEQARNPALYHIKNQALVRGSRERKFKILSKGSKETRATPRNILVARKILGLGTREQLDSAKIQRLARRKAAQLHPDKAHFAKESTLRKKQIEFQKVFIAKKVLLKAIALKE